jgi:N-acetylglucosamine-6-phosphate deacetylase
MASSVEPCDPKAQRVRENYAWPLLASAATHRRLETSPQATYSRDRSLVIRGGVDASGAPLTVNVQNGVIADAAPPGAPVLDASGLTVAPGLIDLQVNGACGIDITAEPERLWEVAAELPRFGVTAFAPTVITSSPEARKRALAALAATPNDGWIGSAPLGLHLEGPMLAPARKGAHPAQWLTEPSPAVIAGWSRNAGVLIVTLAPELPGAIEVIRELTANGVVVSIGHTEADARTVEAAIAAGATMLTHLGNAMPPVQSRDPGPVGVALGGNELVAGVIADGLHLDGSVVSTAWRCLGPTRFLAVTDATAGLGVPDGSFQLGDQPMTVRDGAVRLADGTLAGSAASLPHCLRFLTASTGCTLAEALHTCTTVPATLIGDQSRGVLAMGTRGDLTLFDRSLDVAATIVGGVVVYQRER